MAKLKKSYRENPKAKISPFKDYWNKINFTLLFISIGLLVVGYFVMSIGSWDNSISLSISPIILLIVYLILFPLVILITKKSEKKDDNVSSQG